MYESCFYIVILYVLYSFYYIYIYDFFIVINCCILYRRKQIAHFFLSQSNVITLNACTPFNTIFASKRLMTQGEEFCVSKRK